MDYDLNDFLNACDEKDHDLIVKNMANLCTALKQQLQLKEAYKDSKLLFLDEGFTAQLDERGELVAVKAIESFLYCTSLPKLDSVDEDLQELKMAIEYIVKEEYCDGALDRVFGTLIDLYYASSFNPNLNFPKRILYSGRELVNYEGEIWTSTRIANAYVILRDRKTSKEFLYQVATVYDESVQYLTRYFESNEPTLNLFGYERVSEGFILIWENELRPFHALAPLSFNTRQDALNAGSIFSVRSVRYPLNLEFQCITDERAHLPYFQLFMASNQFTKVDSGWVNCVGNSWLSKEQIVCNNEQEAHVRYSIYSWLEEFNNPLNNYKPIVTEFLNIKTSPNEKESEEVIYVKLSDEDYKKFLEKAERRLKRFKSLASA